MKYSVSYITRSGLVILNNIINANSSIEAINEIKGTEGLCMVLSVTPITLK